MAQREQKYLKPILSFSCVHKRSFIHSNNRENITKAACLHPRQQQKGIIWGPRPWSAFIFLTQKPFKYSDWNDHSQKPMDTEKKNLFVF